MFSSPVLANPEDLYCDGGATDWIKLQFCVTSYRKVVLHEKTIRLCVRKFLFCWMLKNLCDLIKNITQAILTGRTVFHFFGDIFLKINMAWTWPLPMILCSYSKHTLGQIQANQGKTSYGLQLDFRATSWENDVENITEE